MSRSGICLVTGANGFIGSALLARFRREGIPALGVVRAEPSLGGCVSGPVLDRHADWTPFVAGCDVVVHAAARVHVVREMVKDPLFAFREVNAKGTLRLAEQAAGAGVRRFVFISSIKVNGEQTLPGQPFTVDDEPSPQDAYATSKADAETELKALAKATGMEVVIIRPPLVYGPGVKANFLSMMQWLRLGVPLPLGEVVHNRRAFVALDNLVDLIVTCVDHPYAANQLFLAGDGEDLATADLLRRLAAAMGVSARLISVPIPLLMGGARLVGREAMIRRLCGSLQVDISKTRQMLGWNPPISVDEGLRRAASGIRR